MFGVLSLILWALIFIVTFKYVIVLLRADNNGEGGTLTLMALARKATGDNTAVVVMLGIIGAALFFGDALITPAISVLSAIEGLKDVQSIGSQIEPYIVPHHGRDPGGAVRRPVARHRQRGELLRPDHDGVVRRHRGAGRDVDRVQSERAARAQSATTGSRSCSATASSGWSRWARCSSR